MSEFQSLRYRKFCFHVYRSAVLLSWFLERRGFVRLGDAVYWFLPLKLCNIGYQIWKGEHFGDYESFLDDRRWHEVNDRFFTDLGGRHD